MTCDCSAANTNGTIHTNTSIGGVTTSASTVSYMATIAGTMNPARNNAGNAASSATIPISSVSTSSSNGGCPCANVAVSNAVKAASATASTVGTPGPLNAAYSDDATTSNAETLLSSNAKFQAISAIAVTQDGVINVADQGIAFSCFVYYFSL